jgi:hypothetical protein
MGACKLTLYDHEDFGGDKQSFTSSKKLHGSGDMFDRDASGRVTGDCKNTTFLGFEHWPNDQNGGVAWLMGEGDNERTFKHKYDNAGTKCAYGYHRFFRRHDRVGDIVKIDIPPENINEGIIREDITVYGKRNDHNPCEWGHFPVIIRTGDGQYSANDTDQWLTGQSYKGQPCPSGDAYWKGHQKVSCVYKGADKIKELSRAVKDKDSTKDPRVTMYDNIVKKFCSKAENLNKIVTHDNNTCQQYDTSKALAKEWCEKNDNIVDDTLNLCTHAHLGTDIYNKLAEKYCKANPDKDFCACYNVAQPGFCAQAPNAPGCKTVQPIWDKITESLDEGDIAQFEGMQPCYGSVCAGNVYQPTDWNSNCNRDISICKADFDIGGDLVGSNISLKQDCGNTNEGGGGGGTTTSTTDTEEEKSLIEKVFKLEEDKDKKLTEKRTTKIGGTVSSVSSCFMCMIAIVLFT